MFKFSTNFETIKSIYTKFNRGDLIVDHSYQRRSVWGEKDKVRLIETILLNLVIPELFFWQASIDPETGDSVVHIVDGQQRIKAISSFIKDEFKLKESILLEEESRSRFGSCYFKDLSDDLRSQFWTYKLSVVEIDPVATKEDITRMFRRLNLTDYNLNDQEKRNSLSGEFASLSKEIAEFEFWENYNLFKASDIRRMRDIEFCSSLLLLCRKGIIDQSDQTALNEAYENLQSNYDDADNDRNFIENAIKIVEIFIKKSKETRSFLRRKTHLFTMFSLAFYSLRELKIITDDNVERFSLFVNLYSYFKDDDKFRDDLSNEEKELYDEIKKYKMAASEGLNKHSNRMIRYNVLRKIIFDMKSLCILSENLIRKMKILEPKQTEFPI